MASLASNVFPDEMWEEISERIEDPQDWLNFSLASVSIQRLLQWKKVDKLLPEVLISLAKYLKYNDLMKLRSTSKSWNKTVDEFAKEKLSIWWWDSSKKLKIKPVNLRNISLIQKFYHDMEMHQGNPFVQSLNLVSDEDPPDLFWESVVNLLKRCGKHIRTLFLSTTHSREEDNLFSAALHGILKHVPNLKELAILEDNPNSNLTEAIDIETNDLYPVLEKIEYLTVCTQRPYFLNGDMVLLLQRMCKYPENVTHLYVTRIPGDLPSYFPSVQVLQSNFCYEYDWDVLRTSKWPLRELWGRTESDTAPTLRLNVIRGFKKTLTKLRFDRVGKIMGFLEHQKILLPALKHLEIEYIDCEPIPLKYFSELKNLEVLILKEVDFHQHLMNSGTDLISMDIDMYKSNIWTVFPNLKKMLINENTYRRVIYESEYYCVYRTARKKQSESWCVIT